ncbi:MAG: hypothetical protein LBS01_01195 [Prevotellaceae bacterium]|jgi:hypothetical protein|nr:hypothetical protein [Prevotellaceae bacterium]
MKKGILILGVLALMSGGQSLSAQVGINTDAPKTTLDIVQKDTATVKGKGFRLVDGNERKDFALMCDSDGVGTWRQLTMPVIFGKFKTDKKLFFPFKDVGSDQYTWHGTTEADSAFLNTGAYIELPPGMWRVDGTFIINGDPIDSIKTNDYKLWLRGTFGDNDTVRHISPDMGFTADIDNNKLISGMKDPNSNYAFLSGSVIIRNTGKTTKRYYFILGAPAFFKGSKATDIRSDAIVVNFFGYSAEHSITAIPINMPASISY